MESNRIDIIYFTDPLCCWSWALEPQWRKLTFQYRDHLKWEYCLGGLIPSWNGFVDNINSVSRPAQMGPLWMHSEQISGMPTAARLWNENPPSSSFPPCIAVKCATLQSDFLGQLFLRKLREFCHVHGKNISEKIIIYEAASELANDQPSFQLDMFMKDFQGKTGQEAFRKDWDETKRSDISRFPTLMLRKKDAGTIQISGYRSFDTMRKALFYLNPSLQQIQLSTDIAEYREYWGSLMPREELEFITQSELQA